MIGTVIAGRFALEREAGSGGMGTVYEARDLTSGARVALKLMVGIQPSDAERFGREATILADLVHPNIVRYVAHGKTPDGRRYLAMEWLQGEHLAARVDRRSLSVREVLTILRQTAAALALAHARGIVHRDIKPENLFLIGGAVDQLKLIDFGIARMGSAAQRLTRTGAIVGTPAFLAPEIISGVREVDARADVFSLGCVAFFALTGRAPFDAPEVGAVLAKILSHDRPSLTTHCPSVPPRVATFVASLIARDPEARPADGAAVMRELEEIRTLDLEEEDGLLPKVASARLTRREQRIGCVVMARMGQGDLEPIAQSIALTGAELRRVGDRELLIVAPAMKATDQAAVAARTALDMASCAPAIAVAICTGAGEFSRDRAQGPGGVIEAAARRLAETSPGRISLDDATAALLEGTFELDRSAAGTFLRARRASAEPRRSLLGKVTPFVGRVRELGVLTGSFLGATTEGTGGAVIVTGAPGSGKSRLRREFLDWVDRSTEPAVILLSSADAATARSPFAVLGQALRGAARIDEADGVEDRRRKFSAQIGEVLGHGLARDGRDRTIAFLGELAGVPFPDDQDPSLRAARNNPQLMSDGMRLAWEDWLEAACAAQPVVLVLEDLHWGDAASITFVDVALRRLKNAPLLVVAFARPEIENAFPDLWAAREPQTLRLGPLSRKAAEQLIRGSLGANVPASLTASLADRADGNPFFLEELIRAAHEGRTDHMPSSVLGMVQARLDGEGEAAKRILRAASIFGERFSAAGLSALLEGDRVADDHGGETAAWLTRLIERELLLRVPTAAAADGSASELFTFGHALIREAAYAMLTDEDRVLGHRLAGRHLASVRFCDPIVVAEHFRRGEDPEKAIPWYEQAAAQALAANQLAVAIERAALGLAAFAKACDQAAAGAATQAAEQAAALQLIRAEAHLWRGEFEPAAVAAGAAAAVFAPGAGPWLRAMTQMIVAAGKQGALDEVAARVRETSLVLIDPDARDAYVTCLGFACMFLSFGGRVSEADELLSLLDDLVGDGEDVDPQALALVHQARSIRASARSDIEASLTSTESALAAFERAGDLRNACTARANLGFLCTEVGDLVRAEVVLREALTAAARMELAESAAIVEHNLGRVLALLGDTAAAESVERAAVESFEKQGEPRLLGLARVYLAEILTSAGRSAEARAEAEAAEALLVIAPALHARALAACAQARLASGEVTQALEIAQRAQAELDRLGSVEEGEAEIRLRHAECLAAAGRSAESEQAIAEARDRLLARAARIASQERRLQFLESVPANARTLALARGGARSESGAGELLRTAG